MSTESQGPSQFPSGLPACPPSLFTVVLVLGGCGKSCQGAACGSLAAGMVTWIGWLGEGQDHERHEWSNICFESGVKSLSSHYRVRVGGGANVAIRVDV